MRIRYTDIFLTYPQSKLCKDVIKQALIDLSNKVDNNFRLVQVQIAEETHQDGGIHFHCLVKAAPGFDTRNPRIFDVNNEHPNI